MAVLDSNDAPTNNVIPPTTVQPSGKMSIVTLNPSDTPAYGSIGSRRSCQKRGKSPTVSILVAPPRINTDGAIPAPTIRVRANSPSMNLPVLAQSSPIVNKMVANFNNQVKKLDLDLDLSGPSELEITSPDVVPTRTSPLPTVDEHEARVTSIDTKSLGSSVPTHSSEKVAYKKLSRSPILEIVWNV
jgi:hypothetical protein